MRKRLHVLFGDVYQGAELRHLELNPVERVWLFLRERFLSHRLLEGYDDIVSACCEAWNALTPKRLRSLCAFPWLAKVSS